ncbi:MAG: winged helix-turn-helix domain-containing protein [Candidatus Aenigmatarchaeota archaeon]
MEIDRKTLKALAADTRLDILKSLGKRRKTPSELSKELHLATSTVTEHLEKLEKADLIKREETGHKWIYYSLSRNGENLVKPKYPVQFVFMLSITIIVIISASILMYGNYSSMQASDSGEALSAPMSQRAVTEETAKIGISNMTNETNITNTTNSTFP